MCLKLPFEVGITALGFQPRFEAAVGISIGCFQDPPVAEAVQKALAVPGGSMVVARPM